MWTRNYEILPPEKDVILVVVVVVLGILLPLGSLNQVPRLS